MKGALPEGRVGQGLALAVTALALVLLWLGGLAPVWTWFAGRAAQLGTQQQQLAHTQALRGGLPAGRTRLPGLICRPRCKVWRPRPGPVWTVLPWCPQCPRRRCGGSAPR